MRRIFLGDTFKAKLTALVFGYEAVALGLGPVIKRRFGVDLPVLTDIAIKYPFNTGMLAGLLSFHLHVHYLRKTP